jgi:hypothetical protein
VLAVHAYGHVHVHVHVLGSVRRDVTGVESRLKETVQINHTTASLYFLFERDTIMREVKKTGFRVFATVASI